MGFFTGKGSIFDMGERFPLLNRNHESSVDCVFLAGDVTGSPDIKAALNQGTRVGRHVAKDLPQDSQEVDYDVVVIGGGPAGVAAALELEKAGVRYIILERKRLFNTLRSFAQCKQLYYPSTGDAAVEGPLPFEGDKESCDLLERWDDVLKNHSLNVRIGEMVKDVVSRGGIVVRTDQREYRCRRAIIAVGRLIHFKKLDVIEGNVEKVFYELPESGSVADQDVLVVGVTEEALEAVRTLAERNRVSLVCLGEDPNECEPEAVETIRRMEKEGKVTFYGQARLTRIDEQTVTLRDADGERSLPNDRVYVRAGVDHTSLPVELYEKCKIAYDRDWHLWRYLALLGSLLAVGGFYVTKKVNPDAIQIGAWNLDKLYPLVYTLVVLGFGIKAIRRWGAFRWRPSPSGHGNQTLRLSSLIFFQVFFFFILPEFIVRDWMAYSIVYPWPLVLSPVTIQAIMQSNTYWFWGLFLTLIALPVFTLFHGKKFCTWVCGCGGLAETLGDTWRHYSPKGKVNTRRERYLYLVTALTLIATVIAAFGWDVAVAGWNAPKIYSFTVDLFLIAVIPVALYPFSGGKTWCRYWCPVVGWMNLVGKKVSRFLISPEKKRCIACGMCSRYCEVGVDVMKFALKGEPFGMENSSCIGCGICLQVCPTDVLRFGKPLVQIGSS
ncbi:MAG: NAD(P)-binding domain-containing protein [Acidobacteria bacterium]|nr:NAD(P)-binding domain-containing protein [Acidobacteriota bacterium]